VKIGIVGAMPEEIALLQKNLHGVRSETRGMREYLQGELYGQDVTLVFSRWGKVAAASTVTTLIEVYGVELVVFTGVAGAISTGLELGDVVIASGLIQYDLDASALPGLERFEVPLLNVSEFTVEPRLLALAKQSAERYVSTDLATDVPGELLAEFGIQRPKVRTGLIISGDRFIAGNEIVKGLMEALPNAQCVEMEGAAVAQVCFEHKVPVIVMRTISDRADHSAAIDFPKFVQRIASKFTSGVLKQLIAQIERPISRQLTAPL